MLAKVLNEMLAQDYVRVTLAVLTGVFAGYTLTPVPAWLSTGFATSDIFKALVLFIFALVVVRGADVGMEPAGYVGNNKVMIAGVVSVGLIALFRFARLLNKSPIPFPTLL